MKAVILAGGFGTRLTEYTDRLPKPMVKIGDRPILWHIMKIYATYGVNDFIIALGYKSEVIKEYFINYYHNNSDFTVDLQSGEITCIQNSTETWKVTLVDTGLETMTGGRLKRLSKYLDETFMLTYGDGVSDVDLDALKRLHSQSGAMATITTVHPTSKYGKVDSTETDLVTRFDEKPKFGGDWINAGFMVLEPAFIDLINGDEDMLEHSPMNEACERARLYAYKHSGFWKCMDTVRDHQELEKLWSSGNAPWKVWGKN